MYYNDAIHTNAYNIRNVSSLHKLLIDMDKAHVVQYAFKSLFIAWVLKMKSGLDQSLAADTFVGFVVVLVFGVVYALLGNSFAQCGTQPGDDMIDGGGCGIGYHIQRVGLF